MSIDSIPNYLVERVRRSPPPGAGVVPGSTPVLAFGDARHATVATLGLNPSRVEFLDRAGRELPEPHRRLETLRSLGVAATQDLPDHLAARVIAGCDGYYQRNPYWYWFRPLDAILRGIGASYADGSACHLDLVQWATDPTWRGLSPATRRALLAADAAFLHQQLTRERIALLLLNGRSVVEAFRASMGAQLAPAGQVSDRRVTAQIVAGDALGSLRVIGWSTNIQSSMGVTHVLRERLGAAVAEIARTLRGPDAPASDVRGGI